MRTVALARRTSLSRRKLEAGSQSSLAHRKLVVVTAAILATAVYASSAMTVSAAGPRSPSSQEMLLSKTSLGSRGQAVGLAPRPGYTSGWVAYQSGAVVAYGGAPYLAPASVHLAPVVGIAASPTSRGYWLVTTRGQVTGFGSARAYPGPPPTTAVVGIAPSASGHGYLLLDSSGTVYPHGDAVFDGDASEHPGPFKAIATTPDHKGYWLLSATGRVYNYGDASNYGSRTPRVAVGRTFIALGTTPNGRGYWEATVAGKVWSYGNAPVLATQGAQNVVSIVPAPTGQGYVEIDSKGNIYRFGHTPDWVPTPTRLSASEPSTTATLVAARSSTSTSYSGTTTAEMTVPPATIPGTLTPNAATALASATTAAARTTTTADTTTTAASTTTTTSADSTTTAAPTTTTTAAPTTTTTAAPTTTTTAAPTTTTTAAPTTTTTTADPTTTLAPTTTTAASTSPQPVGTVGGPWDLMFDSEFGGSSLDTSQWSTGAWGASGITVGNDNIEQDCYDPAQVGVANAALTITAIAQAETCGSVQQPYTTGSVTTYGQFSFTYGYMEARIWLPGGDKVADWPGFWAVGEPYSDGKGEIDVVEGIGGRPCATVHDVTGAGTSACATGTFTGGWHTFAADWEPGSVTFYYDGTEISTVTSGVTSFPMFLIIDLALSTEIAPPDIAPATMRVAYVRVWQH